MYGMAVPRKAEDQNPCKDFLLLLQSIGAEVADFYLLLGREWPSGPVPSLKIRRGVKKQCYQNAMKLAQSSPDTLAYCEGYALPKGLFPVHHAWCVTQEGVVVDPTWDTPGSHYFGIALDTEFCWEWMVKTGYWGLLGEHVPAEVARLKPEQFVHQSWRNPAVQLERWAQLATARLAPRRSGG
jgi:hypothetical protein